MARQEIVRGLMADLKVLFEVRSTEGVPQQVGRQQVEVLLGEHATKPGHVPAPDAVHAVRLARLRAGGEEVRQRRHVAELDLGPLVRNAADVEAEVTRTARSFPTIFLVLSAGLFALKVNKTLIRFGWI